MGFMRIDVLEHLDGVGELARHVQQVGLAQLARQLQLQGGVRVRARALLRLLPRAARPPLLPYGSGLALALASALALALALGLALGLGLPGLGVGFALAVGLPGLGLELGFGLGLGLPGLGLGLGLG